VPFGLIVENMSVLDIIVLSPDSTLSTEQHRMNDTTFTYSFVPPRGDSRITFNLTDHLGNIASTAVRVTRSDRARAQKPLYKELPVRPPSEAAVETTVAETGSGNPDTTAVAPSTVDDKVTPDTAKVDGYSSLWWLLLLAALIIFFILWIRRRKKNEETDKA
ncbi:MAG TPA: hypothetical protein VFB86_06160, partial [Bacteroidales bacterium]|nr:hypothetical protein [Bacteroidales bacterium]